MSFRIPQDWLDSIVYLYPDTPSAESGDEIGGTGFLLGWPLGDGSDQYTLWAVTNRHVIEQSHWTIRVNKKGGGFEFIDTDDRQWLFHQESDLAVRPIQLSRDIHKFTFLTKDWLLTKDWCNALDIGPGDDCISVGRFVGHAGKKSNNPVARFGQISQSPIEPVKIDGRDQECFLVESRSIGGSSGSPVFVHLDTAHYRPTVNLKTAPDGSVLGFVDKG